jgi:hypothetical protein
MQCLVFLRIVVTLALASACAAEQPAVRRPATGPPIFILPEAVCSSDASSGPTTGMVPDAALCEDLVVALKQAFRDIGYRVVESPDDPHVANVRIAARQSFTTDSDRRPTSFLAVQVMVESEGQEIDRAVEDGDGSLDGGEKAQVRSFARAIATELAHSRRMRAAGLVPSS